MTGADTQPATLHLDPTRRTARAAGAWTVRRVDALTLPPRWPGGGAWTLDTTGLTALDTAGAWALERVRTRAASAGATLEWAAAPKPAHAALVALVRERTPTDARADTPRPLPLEALGRAVVSRAAQGLAFLDFLGRLVVEGAPVLRRLRLARVVQELNAAGVRALPILGLLAFLMGVVIAYQAGESLRTFGANVFVVNLVAVTMLREMGPLLAAIIVAGRTGAAYTAEIGTMRITEELDALRAIGIPPMDMLVVPKTLALVLALPLLTLYASALGIVGGMVVADARYGIGYGAFIERLPHTFVPSSYWVGLIKAPVFALIIAVVACHRGLAVNHSAESIGLQTTASVVQSIFLVIVADAVFSVIFQVLYL